jgi:hypothetical protein
MSNELAERNTREKDNGVISPSTLHVNRRDFRSRLVIGGNISDNISGGILASHGIWRRSTLSLENI